MHVNVKIHGQQNSVYSVPSLKSTVIGFFIVYYATKAAAASHNKIYSNTYLADILDAKDASRIAIKRAKQQLTTKKRSSGVFATRTYYVIWPKPSRRDSYKPKFHYADFPVTSATSPRQTRDVSFSPYSITPISRTGKFRGSRRSGIWTKSYI